MSAELSDGQLEAISAIERACSVLSLLGCVFIIVTFCASSSFHKPINRLVFYASFGNMMTNVGTLISRNYINSIDSAGCQLQAFLIQMFMPADAFWTLAMAVNVYLTFYYKYDARKLRRMEIPYLIICYGVPFIPAFAYIFLRNKNGQRAYGNATLWCWVSSEWDVFRIATFYGPVWVVIFITFFIYIRAGRTIYEKRKLLDKFQSSDQDPQSSIDAISTLKTTEVIVTSESMLERAEFNQPGGNGSSSLQPNSRQPNPAYSVHISADAHHPQDMPHTLRGSGLPANATISAGKQAPRVPNARRRNYEINNAAWAYTKCAILFFTAMLITWIPSSANRVYSVVHHNEMNIPLEFMSAFVLPLQGFWNAVIYIMTSWSACQNLMADIRMGKRPEVVELVGGMRPQDDGMTSRPNRISQRGMKRIDSESESTTELAISRNDSTDGRPSSSRQ